MEAQRDKIFTLFHLQEKWKFIETENRMVVSKAWKEGKMGVSHFTTWVEGFCFQKKQKFWWWVVVVYLPCY